MRVMLHGAINMSNYGDYLFAEMFGTVLKKNGVEVEYYAHPKYGISDYFAKYLGYSPDRVHYKEMVNKCDALVFISGGYFVEPLRKRPFSEYRHVKWNLTFGEQIDSRDRKVSSDRCLAIEEIS